MKITLLVLLSALSLNAFSFSFVPDRIVTPLLDIFNPKNKELGDGTIQVRVTTYSKRGALSKNGGRLIVKVKDFANYKEQSNAVYQMVGDARSGTAFHIGHNLVLTNHHVLTKNKSNLTHCDDFKLKERDSSDFFECKKVHHCNAHLDVCLVEMKPLRKKKGCLFCRKEHYEVSMVEALKLRATYDPTPDESDTSILTSIGNSKGLGIHLSRGLGLIKHYSSIHFYSGAAPGNSGGPLLDEMGIVVGVVRAESKNIKVSNDVTEAYNVAASADVVVIDMREALAHDKMTLEKFNSAVLE